MNPILRFALLTCKLALVACWWQPVSAPEAALPRLDAGQLLDTLDRPNWLIVDIRNSNAYNGWRLGEAVRGGHIPGAENLALGWVRADPGGQDSLLEAKGITPRRRIVVYGDRVSDSEEWVAWFQRRHRSPVREIYLYADSIAQWSGNPDLPLDRLPRFEKLVYPGWVNQLIQGRNPETYRGNQFRVVEVAWKRKKRYLRGHIPGAVYLDTEELESEPLWNVISAGALQKALLAKGIRADTLVVVYSRDLTAAARAASAMMYTGVQDVRLLNGGFQAWLAARLAVEQGDVSPQPVNEFGSPVPRHPEYLIGTEQARRILQNPSARLVSVRSWAEFIGEISGYKEIDRKGRIAGAVLGYSGSDPAQMHDYRNPDNTMRSAREISTRWRRVGIKPDLQLSFYCGTGWRASEVFFYAHVMGFEGISVYDGGWLEWSRDPSNPIAKGDPRTVPTSASQPE